MSTNKWTNVTPYNGILPSNEKEQTANLFNNLGKSQKHYVKWRKSLWPCRLYTLNPFYDILGKENIVGTENRAVVSRGWWWGKEFKGT